jgi:hypothetical protein
MTTKQVAERLVTLCRAGQHEQAMTELYGPGIVSVESFAAPGMSAEIRGIDAVAAKAKWWYQTYEFLGGSVSDPVVSDTHFAVSMTVDVKDRTTGATQHMSEIAVYEVKEGKIVHERFVYAC